MIGLEVLSDQKVIQILRVIFSQKEPITGHGISKRLKMSSNTATKYCEQLVDAGILSKEIIGKAYCYRLRDGYVSKELLAPLFQKEAMIGATIEEKMKVLLRPVCSSLIIYGDLTAQRLEDTVMCHKLSPYTICCVVKQHDDILNSRIDAFESWLNSEFNIQLDAILVTHEELMDRQSLPLYEKISNTGINVLLPNVSTFKKRKTQ